MRARTIVTASLVLAVFGWCNGTTIAQQSCNLPLPCRNTTAADDPAFAITNTGNGRAGLFTINDTGNSRPALEGRTNSTADDAVGVVGRVSTTAPGDHSAGVRGINNGGGGDPAAVRIGVWGQANASNGTGVLGQSRAGLGVNGTSETGVAIFGETSDPSGGIGVWGNSNARGVVGTQGETSCAGTYGVGGCATTGAGTFGRADQGIGVWGNSNARGVVGTLGATSCAGTYGMGGCAVDGDGVVGRSTNGRAGFFEADPGIGVLGRSNQSIGVWGNSNARGVVGTLGATSCAGTYGVGGCAVDGDGVVGRSSNGRAGFFVGNVVITGSLTKGSGAFKIDHPLDPEHQYLYHSFVESAEMLSLYTGNVVLDAQGQATVALPAWFEALNRDFRYQLTAIGRPAPTLYIAEEIADNRFTIAGGQPGMKVSWQVTGVRHDPYAQQHRIPVEEWKPEGERGKYLHPAAYGKSPELGVHFVRPLAPADASAAPPSQSVPYAADRRSVERDGGH
jgi:hypothetical protein